MQGETRTIKIKRVGPGVLAAGVLTAVGVGIVGMMPQASAASGDPIHKSYVCKYVGTPGVDERLQPSDQNPIFVDNSSLTGKDNLTFVGETFSDAQGRSVVIVANTGKLDPEPTVANCPATPPTTKTSTTTPATKTSTTSKPGGAGMPGSGAPRTGEVGAINPVNGLAALGLLGAAGALLAVRSRRHAGERRA